MKSLLWPIAFLAAFNGNCQSPASGTPASNGATNVLVTPAIEEGSGIADSQTHPGALWVIEDSGNPAQLILLGHNGTVRKRLPVRGATNQDWEDVVLSNGFLYIGDIGDNGQKRKEYRIYKFPEPAAGTHEVTQCEAIRFRYEDGSHDAEAFLVQPHTGDVYIITKRDDRSGVYKLAQPYGLSQPNVARRVATLPFNGVVSAALSPDGSAVLVKTYPAIYRFATANGAPLEAAFTHPPVKMPYEAEPQGEAVCYRLNGTGYFTLSEQLLRSQVQLFFYAIEPQKASGK